MFDAALLVRWLADPARHEELLGDLEELRSRRSPLRVWYDALSVCVRQSRLRAGSSVRLAAAAVVLSAAALLATRSTRRTVHAVDAMGSFTLDFDGPRVIGGTLDGAPLPAERLVQADGRLVIVRGNGAQDLHIRLRPDGHIYWRGRGPKPDPHP